MPIGGLQPIIIEVVPGSPADMASLKEGDIILSIDGEKITGDYNLEIAISEYEPGDEVTLEIKRAGEEELLEINIELSEHPEHSEKPYLGITYTLAPAIGLPAGRIPFDKFEYHLPGGGEGYDFEHRFEFPENMPHLEFFHEEKYEGIESGVIIVEVIEESPASTANLRSGDVITAINGETIDNPHSLVGTISSYDPGDEITVTIYRPDEENEINIEIKLGEHPEDPEKGFLGVVPLPLINRDRFHNEGEFEGQGPFFYFKGLPLGQLPFDELPFDLDELPLDQLPFDFEFEYEYQTPGENET
jgi:membrane-associated protease RseP (regulator of RpoE activity)